MANLTQLATVSDPITGDLYIADKTGEKIKNVRRLHVDRAILRKLAFETGFMFSLAIILAVGLLILLAELLSRFK